MPEETNGEGRFRPDTGGRHGMSEIPASLEQPALAPARQWLQATPRIVEALAVSAVPLWGLFHGWSFGTLLLLYWCENLLNTVFIGFRIWLHRRLTHLRGHWRVDGSDAFTFTYSTGGHGPQKKWKPKTFLQSFVIGNLVFALAHGVVLVVFVLGILNSSASGADLRRGFLWLLAGMTMGLLLDLRHIRQRPFAWVRGIAQAAQGRAIVVHLGVIGGVLLLTFTHRDASFFVVFVVLKALLEVGSALPRLALTPERLAGVRQTVRAAGKPGQPEPAWLKNAIDEERKERGDEEVVSSPR
jgi:hypothetical protein